MSFFQAVLIAWKRSACRSSRASSRCIGVTIGVTFLIAVVSIVGGMSRYMQDDLVGKLIAVNSFNLRRQPDIQLGDVTEDEVRDVAPPPAHQGHRRAAPVAAALAARRHCGPTESGGNLDGRIGVRAAPRRMQCSTVSNDWFTIKKMGVAKGRLISAAGVHARHAGRRHRPGRRRPLLPEPRSDRPRAAHPEHSLHRDRRRREAGQRLRHLAGQVRHRAGQVAAQPLGQSARRHRPDDHPGARATSACATRWKRRAP